MMAASTATATAAVHDHDTPSPPWWQFHRRLSFPTMAAVVMDADLRDNSNIGTEFTTIDWGDGDGNEDENSNYDDNYDDEEDVVDDDSPQFDKEPPRQSELLINFGQGRRIKRTAKMGSINNDDDDNETEVEASKALIGNDKNGVEVDPDHRDEFLQRPTQPIPEVGSLMEDVQNCKQASGKYFSHRSNTLETNIDKGGTIDKNLHLLQPGNNSAAEAIISLPSAPSSQTIREGSETDKSASFHGLGLDDSNYEDECLINYSFDEVIDHDAIYRSNKNGDIQEKHGTSNNKGSHTRLNCNVGMKSDAESTTTRPAFRTSKSIEIHDSIWNLSSSGLDYEHDRKKGFEEIPDVDDNTGADVVDATPSLPSNVNNFDDVSSIASSIHSGRVLRKKANFPRLSFVQPPMFGLLVGHRANRPSWAGGGHAAEDVHSERSVRAENITVEDDGYDDAHSRGGESTTSSIRSWQKWHRQPKKRNSFVASLKTTMTWSTNHKTNGQFSSDELDNDNDDYDWDDCDDRCLEEDLFAAKDATNEAIVKDACEIMNTVNNSAIAMGMEPPFLPVAETFPPCKKLHAIIGYQMESLSAALCNKASSTRRKSHQRSKLLTKHIASPSVFSDPPPPKMMDDRQRLSAYIKDQMSMMETFSESTQLQDPSSHSSSCNPYLVHVYTSYLPNYMYYQPNATTTIRPTSLCSGTGITGKSEYLQPDMLHVFRMFGSYLIGSGHLFREEDDDDNKDDRKVKNKHNIRVRRSAFWPDIPENEGENDDESRSDPSSSSSTDDDYRNTRLMEQDEFIQRVIDDLCSSQRIMTKNE